MDMTIIILIIVLQAGFLFHFLLLSDAQAESHESDNCYNTTSCPCCKESFCPPDGSGNCGGNCLADYHGTKCWHRCPQTCATCVDADHGGGVSNCTRCTKGYFSTPDMYQCQQSCSFGCSICNSSNYCSDCDERYLLTESYHCQGPSQIDPECDGRSCSCCNKSCPIDNVNCHCKDGYHGNTCRYICPPNCRRCVDATGQQWPGVANCIVCKNGFYTTSSEFQCQNECPSNCVKCSSPNKCSLCKEGFYLSSSQCEQCDEGCITCDINGTCESCKSGYFHVIANGSCVKCSPLCISCKDSRSCTCSIGCNSNHCNTTNGSCKFGCKTHFLPGNLYTCNTCKPNRYGYECNQMCSVGCTSTTCDRISGECINCKPGFHGNHCDRKCPLNCDGSCNRSTGHCPACKSGYYGNQCSLECPENCTECTLDDGVCIGCVEGFHGSDCNLTCPENCLTNKCDQTTGGCKCRQGFTGERCDQILNTETATTDDAENVTFLDIVIIAVSGGTLVIIGGVCAVVCVYRRRKVLHRTDDGQQKFTVHFYKQEETRVKKELAVIDAKMIKLDDKRIEMEEQRMRLEERLKEIEENIPYKHAGKADQRTVVSSVCGYVTLNNLTSDESQYSILGKHM